MSIIVRHLTNGVKTGYAVTDGWPDGPEIKVSFYKTLKEMPKEIYDLAPKDKKAWPIEPGLAEYLGVSDIFYPNFPNCGRKEWKNFRCGAEYCLKNKTGSYRTCPYFKEY